MKERTLKERTLEEQNNVRIPTREEDLEGDDLEREGFEEAN